MMTRTQKETILEMRSEGITYKTIAEQMGMTAGSLKMFVSRYNRADDRRCEQCGKLLPKGTSASRRFCTMRCKTMGWNVNPSRPAEQVQHTCMVCGTTFMGRKIPNSAPGRAVMPQCVNSWSWNPSVVMPLFLPFLISTRQKVISTLQSDKHTAKCQPCAYHSGKRAKSRKETG